MADEVVVNGADTWHKGRFLGKGGFAKCYELVHERSKEVVAGKVVPKTMLQKPHQREKMMQEIRIHRKLSHQHVVKFTSYFETANSVYVLLELCKRRSLMELLKRRGKVTYQESRYFMHQLLLGVEYLHSINVIHRDLKLGNLFLDEKINLKIGDFGLATEVTGELDRKKTLCGTPNYIAPEVLDKSGHSFEVDMWSVGCILFTLLVGKPPFETPNIKETYSRIRRVEYRPDNPFVPDYAQDFIRKLLLRDPQRRMTAKQALGHNFFSYMIIPAALPESILTTEPRLPGDSGNGRAVLREIDGFRNLPNIAPQAGQRPYDDNKANAQNHISSIEDLLTALLAAGFRETELMPLDEDAAADPASMPVYWVSKWVDYTDKYGLGYQLCDNSIAVLFNDNTRMVLMPNADSVQFIDNANREVYFTMKRFPNELQKKVVLLRYFNQYMQQHLMKAGADAASIRASDMARLPYLRIWFRTQSAIVLFLSNGILQLNFFRDHTKIVLCPLMAAVSYIDKQSNFRTYSLRTLHESCPTELVVRLKYALGICDRVKAYINRL